jgi:uncharacterized protein (UPF0276 family)
MEIIDEPNLLKFESWIKEMNMLCPVMMHGLYPTSPNIGSKTFIEDIDINLSKKLIALTGVNGVSLHLTGVDISMSDSKNKETFLKNIYYLKKQFYNADFVSFENMDGNPFMSQNKFGICIDPDFISEIILETDSDFLLDISHAYCSAKAIQMDFHEYLNRLPLKKIYEIHINGWIELENDILAHTKINETGYQILQSILAKCTPKIVTIEYGRGNTRNGINIPLLLPNQINNDAKKEIIEQVVRLRNLFKLDN